MKILLLILVILSLAKEDCYKIFGLNKGADLKTVKKQFRKLSLIYHPDKNNSPRAQEKYKTMTNAYQEILQGHANNYDDIKYKNRGQSSNSSDQEDLFKNTYQKQKNTEYQNKKNEIFKGIKFYLFIATILLFWYIVYKVIIFIQDDDNSQNDSENNQQNNEQYQENIKNLQYEEIFN
ncbi:unnamed protein product [Paramecium sonneborni]|uniref:J domain-containing protein n=1 Tax=Paramecium sonneborni TaxID=65129 RepID=A0A8S1LY72_9CILI|nr:unnamed protein product [Paramecium sonneborni]